ncbi:SRPBCC family protein [Luteipulveratus flavus]|uniref:SRPBCC family protein n=1 Tax=Luteipulveratus flavus TaxID=3031728 RepID=A0ABT6C4F8_9MICO|nr:SRPBCC family protein [Luteipulveratus sp. YIM 133296]MDF8263836.1 SRPBCC family protein [Luteipulveratus sp. YIM 133296]
MKGHVARSTVQIDAPPERVWQALTDPDLVETYMMGARVESDWQPGSPITWTGEFQGKKYTDKGEILAVEPNRRLELTHFSPLSGQEDVPDNYHTLVYTLSEQGGGTQLDLDQDNNASAEAAAESQQNWDQMMQGLKQAAEGS